MEQLKDQAWLFDQFVTQNKHYELIAEELGVAPTSVLTHLDEFGLLTRENLISHNLISADSVWDQ